MKKTLFLLFVLIATAGQAQVFPVHAHLQLVPPYSPYLSDYTAPGAQRFMFQVRANDVTLLNYAFRLRLTIEGVGITIRTKQHFVPQPLMLESGVVPQLYYGDDLQEYFHPDALDFTGYSRNAYAASARLPDGVYRFTVEVLDYNRGTVVSNKAMTMAWVVLNDPPLLNLPANRSTVDVKDPLNIVFSWTPRHSGSPNAAFTTDYVFRLVELGPGNNNPYDAFLTQEPLHETETSGNQILYGISEPSLIPGRKYAWQVEARAREGKDLFKNNGRSEVFVFQYGRALPTPQNLQLRWAKPRTLAIRWDKVWSETGDEMKYRLAYRPRKRVPDHEWYETWTKYTDKTLYDLEPDTEYEVKVRSENSVQESAYSPTLVFRTLREEADAFVCRDDVQPPPPPANTVPVFPLSVNDTIHAGGYDVLVRDVMKVGSKYHGSGVAIVPWFNSAKVRVTFEDIRVNDRFWLTSGTIKSTWNTHGNFLLEHQDAVIPGQAPQAGALDITVVSADSLITVTGAAIAAVSQDEDGNIILMTTDGQQQTLPKGTSFAIVDEVGNGYVVDQQGNIAKTTATEAQAAAARGDREYDLALQFARGKGRHGFDEKKFDALSHHYQPLEGGVFAGWKALSSASPDPIEAKLLANRDIRASAIRFEAGTSPVTPLSTEANTFTLSLQGKAAGLEEELLALHQHSDTLPPRVLGKINTATYDPIHRNLVIVPVNDAAIPGDLNAAAIAQSLNEVYAQAVVEWNVIIAPKFQLPLNTPFDVGETGLLSNYTDDMKKVLKAYGRAQPNTYYLFLISEPNNGATLGYMPRNRTAGFVFTGPHQNDAAEFQKTIAHELGHGAFNLRHTFSEHPLPSGTTDNLMDYSPGTALYKYQWDQIHEPASAPGLFAPEEEAANVTVIGLEQLKAFANADGTFTFLAPTGIPFTLPASTQSVKFWTNDEYPDGVIEADDAPDGALIGFTIDHVTYLYHKLEGKTVGSGYKTAAGEPAYIDILSKAQETQQAIIALPCFEEGNLKFIAQQMKFKSGLSRTDHTAEGGIAAKLPIEDPTGPYVSSARVTLDARLSFTYSEEARSFISDNRACANEMVRYVIKAADVIQRNPGYYDLYKICAGGALTYPESGASTTEDVFRMGIYYERLKGFANELLNYIHHTTYTNEHLLNISDPEVLGEVLSKTCEPDFRLFTFEQRKHILTVLSNGNLHDYWLGLGNNRENIVIYTLQQAPGDQHGDILALLEEDSYGLLKTLIRKSDNQLIGKDNFDKLIDAVTAMIQNQYEYENLEEDIAGDRILRWGSTGFLHEFVYECPDWVNSDAAEITFNHTSTTLDVTGIGEITGSVSIVPNEARYTPLSVAPFDFVALRVYSQVVLENGKPILKASVGELQAVPALYLYWMIHRKATDETLAYIKANVNVALFLAGGAEIIAARTGLRLALAIADQATFATSFALEAGPRKLLEEGANGEKWRQIFKAFDAFNLFYGAARLGQGLTDAAHDLLAQRELLDLLKQSEDFVLYTDAQRALIDQELLRLEKGMDELEAMADANTLTLQSINLTGVLNKLNPDLQARIKLLPSHQMDNLLSDLHGSQELLEKMTVGMVDGWEVLANHSILRKKPENLEVLGKWLNNGVTKETFITQLEKARAKQKMLKDLNEAKSKYHVLVIIRDYENIPGVARGRYVENNSRLIDKETKPIHWSDKYDLDIDVIKAFTGKIKPIELKPGDKIYRVSTEHGSGGFYWTRTKPTGLDDVIGGTAVRPEWNNFEYIYEYEVPQGVTIKCWIGKAARQEVSKYFPANYHLPGGDEQLYIHMIAEQDSNFSKSLKTAKTEW